MALPPPSERRDGRVFASPQPRELSLPFDNLQGLLSERIGFSIPDQLVEELAMDHYSWYGATHRGPSLFSEGRDFGGDALSMVAVTWQTVIKKPKPASIDFKTGRPMYYPSESVRVPVLWITGFHPDQKRVVAATFTGRHGELVDVAVSISSRELPVPKDTDPTTYHSFHQDVEHFPPKDGKVSDLSGYITNAMVARTPRLRGDPHNRIVHFTNNHHHNRVPSQGTRTEYGQGFFVDCGSEAWAVGQEGVSPNASWQLPVPARLHKV